MIFSRRFGVKYAPEKPRWIIVGLQTEKGEDQTKNSSDFYHVNVDNRHVMVSSSRYYAADYNISFANQQFGTAYMGHASMFGT